MKQLLLRRPLLLTALYIPVYLLWFSWLQQRPVRHVWVSARLDDYIPFCSAFIIPYLLWFLFVAGTVLYCRRWPEECLRLCAFLYAGMTVCLAIYTLFPNGQLLRPAVMPDDSLCTRLVFLIYQMDPAVNSCPSIHVYNTLGVWNAITRCHALRGRPLVQGFAGALSVSIILSTLFLKQHSVVDVAAALLLAVGMERTVYGGLRLPRRVKAAQISG
ncbi:MAG: serine/threonine protein phosphatase [Clostridiales bacterium]|nr:serine/threonine protein phosphatase [Clostridiales bacterium]